MNQPRIVQVRRKILKENDLIASRLRERFLQAGVRVISLVSSPGSGKTALLENLLTDLSREHKVAALVGDLATENDARRLARSGVPVKQITTGTVCHLDANMVERALESLSIEGLNFLFIENVGNLVCPSSFDIGEDLRLVLVSTTEGEDKPLKYPTIFNSADAAIVTKIDLADVVDCNKELLFHNIQSVRPGIKVFEVSARTGLGLGELKQFLIAGREAEIAHVGITGHT
jgi:hydrogenase nickel incorporation protein HypB